MTIIPRHRMRCVAPLMVLLAVLVLVGCDGGKKAQDATEDQGTTAEAPSLTADQEALVVKAAAIADAIAQAPGTMDQILADNELTADDYKALVYRISADPMLARAYQEARKR